MGDTPVVQSERNKSSGETYTRKIKHFSRPVKSSFQTNFDRMVSGSDDLQLDSVDNGLSKHRSVCDSPQQEVTNLCVSYPRRKGSGDRCNVNELERNARLCVSSVCSDSSYNQQDSPTSLQHSVESSSLGRNVLVSGHSSVSSSTGHSDSLAQKSVDTIGSEICQGKRRKLKTSRLEFIRRSIRDRTLPDTQLKQGNRLPDEFMTPNGKFFPIGVCKGKFILSRPEVADFLLHLFQEKKCQVSTIKGYRSTISNTLKFKSDNNIGSDHVISELIKSFELQRPVERSLAPKWDLSCVLSSLCSEPYEPLHKASRFHLTLKTVFLLALATAKRVSEIHAFSMDSGHLRFNQSDGSVSLRTQTGFLAKNQLPSVCPDDILVQNLARTIKFNDFNRLLCPVRALKRYLKVTEPIRKNRKRLFLPLKGDHDITKGSISGWISNTIRLAYKKLSKSKIALLKIKAHELRALSASWSYMNKIPIEDIIKTAVWSSHSTFAKFYLRDLNTQGENLRLMGPVVSAQKVVGGQSGLSHPRC